MRHPGGVNEAGPGDLRSLGAGPGARVEVPEVSQELARLWSVAGGAAKERIVRACQGNLIVWSLSPDGDVLERVVEEMTRLRPVRVLLLESASGESAVLARVSTLCHLRGVRQRICCEKIALSLPAGSEALTVSAVRSLLRGDVPVILWCISEPSFDLPAFTDLCSDADLLLLDSSRFRDSRTGLERLDRLSRESSHPRPLDWTWERLAGWRREVAEHFESPTERARIPSIREIEVEASPRHDARIPASSLLLGGWMVSCLGHRELTVRFRPGAEGGLDSGIVTGVRFRFDSGPPVVLDCVPCPGREDDLPVRLARLLGHHSGDRAYEGALCAVNHLEDLRGEQP